MRFARLPSNAWARALVLAAALATLSAAHTLARVPSLPAYNVDIGQTSVSGISSGAFMAVQFGMAWSSIVRGVGAIAGGPFGCAEGSGSAALSTCMGGEPAPDVEELAGRADQWARSGAIDDTANLAGQKIYLFNGYNDNVVMRPVSNALESFYARYLGAGHLGNIFYQTAIGAGHSQVTSDYGGHCANSGGEFINNCGYDQAGMILQHIYGALRPRNAGKLSGRILSFDQADFTAPDQPADESLDDNGFAYVPTACETRAPCRVHVVLHGCLQSERNIGEDFVKHAGYNEWADTNQIIVLYPQTRDWGLANPQSCWDWWGYLDADPTQSPTYLLKSGRQIRAIKAMIDRLSGGATPSATSSKAGIGAPAVVLAPDSSDTAIDVVWSSVPGAASYELFRAGPDDREFRLVGTVSGLSFGDSALRPATQYRYEVRARFAAGRSPFSASVAKWTQSHVPPCGEPGTCAVR